MARLSVFSAVLKEITRAVCAEAIPAYKKTNAHTSHHNGRSGLISGGSGAAATIGTAGFGGASGAGVGAAVGGGVYGGGGSGSSAACCTVPLDSFRSASLRTAAADFAFA